MSLFFRSPKGFLLVALVLLGALATLTTDGVQAGRGALWAVGAASIVDMTLAWREKKKLIFPSGAILTGLIVGMVLSPIEPFYVQIVAAGLGVASKHFIKFSSAHIFNPAALGLLVTSLLFASEQSWWGGLADLPGLSLVFLAIAGVIIVEKVNKFPAVLTFIGVYFTAFTFMAFIGNPLGVAEIFRQPFLGTILFFAFFMLTDPPTSPARVSDQVWFALAVAVISFFCYVLTGGAVYYLLVGLLAGNALEGLRRFIRSRSRQARAKSPAFDSAKPLGAKIRAR